MSALRRAVAVAPRRLCGCRALGNAHRGIGMERERREESRDVVCVEKRSSMPVSTWRDASLPAGRLVRAAYGAHVFEPHVHDELVIAVTESGAAHCKSSRGVETVKPLTLWVTHAGECHSGTVPRDSCWKYRAIYLDPLDGDERTRYENIRSGLHDEPGLAALLLRAHRCAEIDAPALMKEAFWLEAMSALHARCSTAVAAGEQIGGNAQAVHRAKDYLIEYADGDVSIEELARLTNLSRFHLMRSFKKTFGILLHRFHLQCKLHKAKYLLRTGTSVADAALSAGFFDQSHFTRNFKRMYGVTPGTFRSLYRDSVN
ncbi:MULTISPECIES: AraC family transcriptional regulator [unclassified Burkholderia]|uniref:AraC family transcriptional regulator n=1 Tax=unclassified Burkholderia TaxID=2613784 RepID=UPI001E4173EB|nr:MULTISPECIES: AraC family transcriptional regulator [unclassified Burkholderia]